MVEVARHFHSIIRWGLVAFLSLIIVGNVFVFLVSVLQAVAPNAGEKFPSTVQEHYGYNKLNTDCTDIPEPARFMHQSDAGEPARYEYCTWKTKLTVWRSLSCVILTIGAGILMGLLAKRSPANDSAAIWQDPKNVLRALLIPSGAMGINMFFLMCFDAAAVQQSNDWCNQMASEQKDDPIVCDYVPFAVTVGLDFILLLFWGLTVLFIFLRQLKRFRPYMQFQDEMEEDMLPGGGEVSWKKKGGKSWISKHLKKAKERQKAASRA